MTGRSGGAPVRVGIVGCGLVGQLYGRTLRRLGAEVVAAADRVEARAAEVAPRAFPDAAAMLDGAQGLDLVCVCSPTPFHREAVMAAARHGRHVFLEKPMAETLADAEAMQDACARAGSVLGVGFKMRFETLFAEARRLVAAGAIGRPRYATFSFVQPVPPGERVWYVDVGVLRDMMVHPFDLACWLLDAAPVAVTARTEQELGRAGEDKGFVTLEYPGGGHAGIMAGYIEGYPEIAGRDDIVFQVVGEGGYLLGQRPDRLSLVDHGGVRAIPIQPVDAFEAELAVFLDALATGRAPPVTGRDGLRAQRIIEAAVRSAASGAARTPIPLEDTCHA